MDTLGPRIMVNVGTQAVSNTGLNPRDLAPLTNDAFLATFMGKTSLSASNGISRQHNNYRQSYTTQMERVTLRSKSRPLTSNGESSMEPDSAILSIIRGNGTDSNQQQSSLRQLQGNRNRRRSLNQQQVLGGWDDIPCSPNYRPTNDLNRRRRTRSGGAHQQITVVDQMAAQPHIPYAILPKRFEPKQVAGNGFQQQSRSSNNNNNNNNNNNFNGNNRRRRPAAPRRSQRQQDYYDDQWIDEEDDDLWLEPIPSNMRRRLNARPNRSYGQNAGYYEPRQRLDNYYDSYSYGSFSRQGQVPLRPRRRMLYQDDGYVPFDIVPSYDLNEWQGPYARSRQSLYSQQPRGGARYGRNDNGFIRDDHRTNGSSRQSRNGYKPLTPTRNGKQSKSPRNKGQQKRHTSRQRKQRNQNSKTEGTPSTNTNELKSSTDEDKQKQESTSNEQTALPPRDQQTHDQNKSE